MRRSTTTISFIAACWLVLAPIACSAAEWSNEPQGSLKLEADSNKRLTTLNPKFSFGEILNLGTVLGYQTDQTTLSFTPKGSVSRYQGDQTLDNETASVALFGRHIWERASLELGFTFSRNTTLATESLTTGLVQTNKPVYSIVVSPSFTYQLSEKNSIQLLGGHQDVSYENGLVSGLFDYTYDHIGTTFNHTFSDTTTGFASFDYSIYDVPASLFTQDTYTVQVGVQKDFTPTLSVSAAAGMNWSESTQRTIIPGLEFHSSSTGQLYSASVTKKFEKWTAEGKIVKNLIPTGSGQQIDSTGYSFTGNYRFSQRGSGYISYGDYENSRQQGNNGSYYARKEVDAEVDYALSRFWSLSGKYSFIQSGTKNAAESHGFYISLKYNGDAWTLSR